MEVASEIRKIQALVAADEGDDQRKKKTLELMTRKMERTVSEFQTVNFLVTKIKAKTTTDDPELVALLPRITDLRTLILSHLTDLAKSTWVSLSETLSDDQRSKTKGYLKICISLFAQVDGISNLTSLASKTICLPTMLHVCTSDRVMEWKKIDNFDVVVPVGDGDDVLQCRQTFAKSLKRIAPVTPSARALARLLMLSLEVLDSSPLIDVLSVSRDVATRECKFFFLANSFLHTVVDTIVSLCDDCFSVGQPAVLREVRRDDDDDDDRVTISCMPWYIYCHQDYRSLMMMLTKCLPHPTLQCLVNGGI